MDESACNSQSDVLAFLADPAAHGLREPIKRIDTHGASVFLAGQDVYKVKRAVRFPFMDFSTLEKRRFACERELAVNRVNAPDLYLGIVPISRDADRLKFGGGDIVEWAVHLRRFDENRTLDRLAEQGSLDKGIVAKLARAAALSHSCAPIAASTGARLALRGQIEETLTSLEAAPDIFARESVKNLRNAMSQAFAQNEILLLERGKLGQVRRCHGDLHLRNIALIDGAPVLFDAIEFDESLATCDVLYDFAFLLMDLWTRGLRRQANLLFNRYLWICDDLEGQLLGLSLLPLFLSLRAAIRAKVVILQPGEGGTHTMEAHRFFEAACAFLVPERLNLVAVGGLSGTGKSSLAAALAPSLGRAPGALHLRSDIERKRLFGVGEFERLPDEAYLPHTSEPVYRRLRDLAAVGLASGQSVILDAVHMCHDERAAAQCIAQQKGAHFTGLWLTAPIATLRERVAKRTKDASDATVEVLAAQANNAPSATEWQRLDASRPVETVATAALAAIMK
jgi:aminoglycoside phosphotransferase family enzyme/predicted kinase